jgi:plasmid stabilization system protein ParE
MSCKVHILGRAQADVNSIFNWLARRSVRGAVSWYLAFGRAVEKIAESPDGFPEAPESDPLGRRLRQSLFKTRQGRMYRSVFEKTPTEIVLLRVRGPGQPRLKQTELPSE